MNAYGARYDEHNYTFHKTRVQVMRIHILIQMKQSVSRDARNIYCMKNPLVCCHQPSSSTSLRMPATRSVFSSYRGEQSD